MIKPRAQFKLRLPQEVRDRLAQSAVANRRSMNAEIVFQLETALAALGPRTSAEVSKTDGAKA